MQHLKAFLKWKNYHISLKQKETNANNYKIIKEVQQILIQKLKPQAEMLFEYSKPHKKELLKVLERLFEKK